MINIWNNSIIQEDFAFRQKPGGPQNFQKAQRYWQFTLLPCYELGQIEV